MPEAVIVDAVRTPVGKRYGALSGCTRPSCSGSRSAGCSNAPASTRRRSGRSSAGA